jgi:opacity protein-like surface antigen
MKKWNGGFKMLMGGLFLFVLALGSAGYAQVTETVNLILKNASSASVEVALIDQYGGNFTVTVDAGTSQNQTLKVKSEIKIAGNVVHVAMPKDEGKEIIIAGQ